MAIVRLAAGQRRKWDSCVPHALMNIQLLIRDVIYPSSQLYCIHKSHPLVYGREDAGSVGTIDPEEGKESEREMCASWINRTILISLNDLICNLVFHSWCERH